MGYVFGSCPQPTLLFGSAGGILEWVNDPAVSILEVRDFLGRIPIVEARNGAQRDIGALLHSSVTRTMIIPWRHPHNRMQTRLAVDSERNND
jgi:hypothetical protein